MAFTHSTSLCCLLVFLSMCSPGKAVASPWADKEGYGAQTGGKFVFGLKHTLFSWMNPWAESHDPVYETPWTGFCAGIGKSVVYTAAGAIQLVTFPIPVDFPNVGLGMHIPANNVGVVAKGQGQKTESDSISTSLRSATATTLDEASLPETDTTLDAPKNVAPKMQASQTAGHANHADTAASPNKVIK